MTTGGWIFMAFAMLVLLVLVVLLVMWIVSQQRKPAGPLPLGMSAREALDHRLVSGEITGEQYDDLREKLDPSAGARAAPSAEQPPS